MISTTQVLGTGCDKNGHLLNNKINSFQLHEQIANLLKGSTSSQLVAEVIHPQAYVLYCSHTPAVDG
jgi:hypothetical protein